MASLLSFLGPPWSQWCSDWCAVCCSAAVAIGCVCLSHVSGWQRLVVVPLGVSCFLSCRGGVYFVAREKTGAQASSSDTAAGRGRHVMRARLVF